VGPCMTNAIQPIHLEGCILALRGQRVILDADLALLYGVTTKALNQAVKRNSKRFPHHFMFQLTVEEKRKVVTDCDHLARLRFSPAKPRAFTEHGAIMAATVLNSERAIEASIQIVNAFVRLRQLRAANPDLARKLDEFGDRLTFHDKAIAVLFDEIRKLAEPVAEPEPEPKRRIGFRMPGSD